MQRSYLSNPNGTSSPRHKSVPRLGIADVFWSHWKTENNTESVQVLSNYRQMFSEINVMSQCAVRFEINKKNSHASQALLLSQPGIKNVLL